MIDESKAAASERPEENWDPFKKTSAALPILGRGRTASVYDMGDGKVLKMFKASIPYETICKELVQTHMAHSCGLPVPDSYDLVSIGSEYGILMDKMEGTVLERKMRQQPEDRLELISRFAKTIKALHQINLSDSNLPDIREESLSLCARFDRDFCSEEEANKICSVFEWISPAETFVHGDCHPGNAMEYHGAIRFIDLMFAGKGHPVFDLLCMYSHYVFLPSYLSEEDYVLKNKMKRVEAEALFDRFLEVYYPEAGPAELSKRKEQIRGIHAAKICLATVAMPGVFSAEMLLEAKRRAILFSDANCLESRA